MSKIKGENEGIFFALPFSLLALSYEQKSANMPKKKQANGRKGYFAKKRFKEMAQEICPNDDERLNIILDMCYGCKNNRLFLWDTIGDLIVKRLEELENDGNE